MRNFFELSKDPEFACQHGSCDEGDDGYECTCDAGWISNSVGYGKCDNDEDECDTGRLAF